MPRRSHRSYMRLPVDLLWTGETGGFQEAGSVIDMSQGGLRVHTGRPLIPGRLLHVSIEGKSNPFAYCRVVWAQTHGSALSSEAGLEILEQLSDVPCSRMSVPPGPVQNVRA
jgi:hypothetical protein